MPGYCKVRLEVDREIRNFGSGGAPLRRSSAVSSGTLEMGDLSGDGRGMNTRTSWLLNNTSCLHHRLLRCMDWAAIVSGETRCTDDCGSRRRQGQGMQCLKSTTCSNQNNSYGSYVLLLPHGTVSMAAAHGSCKLQARSCKYPEGRASLCLFQHVEASATAGI